MPLKIGTWIHTPDYWAVIEDRRKVNSRVVEYSLRPFILWTDAFVPDPNGLVIVKSKDLSTDNVLHPTIFILQRYLAHDRVAWHRDKEKANVFNSSIWQQVTITGKRGKYLHYKEDLRLDDYTLHYFPKDLKALFRILHPLQK